MLGGNIVINYCIATPGRTFTLFSRDRYDNPTEVDINLDEQIEQAFNQWTYTGVYSDNRIQFVKLGNDMCSGRTVIPNAITISVMNEEETFCLLYQQGCFAGVILDKWRSADTDTEDWDTAAISLHEWLLTPERTDFEHLRSTLMHEIGHTLGLAHSVQISSLQEAMRRATALPDPKNPQPAICPLDLWAERPPDDETVIPIMSYFPAITDMVTDGSYDRYRRIRTITKNEYWAANERWSGSDEFTALTINEADYFPKLDAQRECRPNDSADGGNTASTTPTKGTTPTSAPCPQTNLIKVNCDPEGGGIWAVLAIILDILTMGVAILGIIGMAIASIIYITSSGNADRLAKAKSFIFNVVLGIVCYGLLYAVLQFFIPGGVF
jgi:hypothetical protein